MIGILERVKTGTIVLLTILSAYLLYTRPIISAQATKVIDNSTVTENTSQVTTVDTIVTEMPNGEKVTKTTKVISKKADKKEVSTATTNTSSSVSKGPELGNEPSRYSLGLLFPIYPTPSTTPKSIELGYRVLGNTWITSSIGLQDKHDMAIGLRLDF